MVYDKFCAMINDSTENTGNITDPTIIAILAVQGTGMAVGALLLVVTLIHIIFFSNLQDKFMKIQIQICLMILLSQILIGSGFFVSPCQPLEINDRDTFVIVCKILSALQFVCIISSFNWKCIEVGYICHLVAVKCNMEFEKHELALKGLKPKPVTPQPPKAKALYRTFSKDITFERSISRQEVKSGDKSSKPEVEQIKRDWHIKFFSKNPPHFWILMLVGYLPPIGLMGISFSSTPEAMNKSYQLNSEILLEQWMSDHGIDIYCWPGSRSSMIYHMVGAVILITMVTLYLRYKAISMVRLLRSGMFTGDQSDKTVNSVIQWQRQNSGLQRAVTEDDFYIRSSLIVMLVMLCTWVFGTLQSVLLWGLAIPFGTLCFLQGFVYFLFYVAKKYSAILFEHNLL